MTEPIDLAPQLRAWLAEDDGRSLTPGVVASVVSETESVRQLGRPWFVLPAPAPLRAPLAAIGLVVAVLLGLAAFRLVAPPVGTQSPTPSASPSASALPVLSSRDCDQAPTPDGAAPRALGVEVACGHLVDLTGWQALPSDRDHAAQAAVVDFEGGSLGAWHAISPFAGGSQGYGAVIEGDEIYLGPRAVLYLTWYDPIPTFELEARARDLAAAARGGPGDVMGPLQLMSWPDVWEVRSRFEAPGPQTVTVVVEKYLLRTAGGLLLATFAAPEAGVYAFENAFQRIVGSIQPASLAPTPAPDRPLGDHESISLPHAIVADLTGWSRPPSGAAAALTAAILDLEGGPSYGVYQLIWALPRADLLPGRSYLWRTVNGPPILALRFEDLGDAIPPDQPSSRAEVVGGISGPDTVAEQVSLPIGTAYRIYSHFQAARGPATRIDVVQYVIFTDLSVVLVTCGGEDPGGGTLLACQQVADSLAPWTFPLP